MAFKPVLLTEVPGDCAIAVRVFTQLKTQVLTRATSVLSPQLFTELPKEIMRAKMAKPKIV